MSKEEIQNRIKELKTDEEIEAFVKERLQELEGMAVETIVGQGYTDTFKEFISSKTHYKPGTKFGESECPDLVYDDMTPYIELVKEIRKGYNELTLFTSIFHLIYNYLPNSDWGFARGMTYMAHTKDGKVSIKEIIDNSCAFCSENAGLAHNLFRFLGVDSEVACGYRNKEGHAFNVIYPNGYGNEPMVIYDPSFFVSFVKSEGKISLGYFKALRREDYDKLMKGESIKIDLTGTEKNYRRLYGGNGYLDDAYFEGEQSTYSVGLKKVLDGKPEF